jgi:serine/threonine protein kinase/outer membrane protein assembly factor BamB
VEPLTSNDPAQIGPYRMEGVLGAGGMGVVYLGRGPDGARAAVKVVHGRLAADAGFRRRFAREIAVARSVTGPWFARLLDGDADAQQPWLATEYVDHPTLDAVVEGGGPLPLPVVGTLARGLADALAHLHSQGVVHRDLKPSNVLVGDDGPRLIDFGVARAADATALTQTGMVIGTPAFMSPEQAAAAEAGPESDVFSLASTLVYAATGRGPFGRTTNGLAMLRRISDDEPDLTGVPPELREVLLPCLAKDPADRPSAADLAGKLGEGRPPAPGWSPLREWDPSTIGPYRVVGRLGAGAMGQVYLARAGSAEDGADAPLVAVKVVHEPYAADSRFRERFAREIATARAVRGPRVVELLDADPDARVPWLAAEYVPGPSLEQTVGGSGALPEPAVLDVAVGLAEALGALHDRGVVHRDLKPSNVLMAQDGPKLIDFGIARAVDDTALTHTGGVLGPPGFMSPEQAAGEDVGPASDVFSFASVVVFAATGRGPFGTTGSPLALLRRVIDDQPDTTGVPDRLLVAIAPCFAKNPADRPTAPEVADRLRSLAAVPGTAVLPPPTAVQPAPPPDPGGPRRISRRAVLLGGAAAGLTAVGAAGWLVVRAATQPPPVREPRWSVTGPSTGGNDLRVIADDPQDRLFVAAKDRFVALDPDSGETTWSYSRERESGAFGVNGEGFFLDDWSGVAALDIDTGAEIWSQRYGSFVLASNAVTLCELYSSSEQRGILSSVLPSTGTIWWTNADIPERISSAVSSGDYIHLMGESRIFAIDTSGKRLWEQPKPAAPSWGASSAALFLVSGGRVEALNPRTGTTTWYESFPTDPGRDIGIACDDHSVYVAGAKSLEARDAGTGQPRWRVEQPVVAPGSGDVEWEFRSAPACTADLVFVAELGLSYIRPRTEAARYELPTPQYDFRVSVRSAQDGTTLWTVPLPAEHDEVTYAVATNQVYVGSFRSFDDGTTRIHAVSVQDPIP